MNKLKEIEEKTLTLKWKLVKLMRDNEWPDYDISLMKERVIFKTKIAEKAEKPKDRTPYHKKYHQGRKKEKGYLKKRRETTRLHREKKHE